MAIEKLDYATAVIEALQGAYRQDWCLTNWTGTGKPLLPAGMIISILGYPYLVSGGDEEPADPAADGAVYLKVTPDAPAGATATAVYTNTFSGTWSEAYNGFYDGDSLFLNVFMTKTGANWTAKGTWLNFREKKLALISDGLTVGNLSGINGVFSGDVSGVKGTFTDLITCKGVYAHSLYGTGTEDTLFDALKSYIPNTNDTIIISGGVNKGGANLVAAYSVRASSSQIDIYGFNIGVNSGYLLSFTDGNSTVTKYGLSW